MEFEATKLCYARKIIKLKPVEAILLENHDDKSEIYQKIISNITRKNDNQYHLSLSINEAKFLHEHICTRIDVYGFNESYELTKTGSIYQGIIDKLFDTFLGSGLID